MSQTVVIELPTIRGIKARLRKLFKIEPKKRPPKEDYFEEAYFVMMEIQPKIHEELSEEEDGYRTDLIRLCEDLVREGKKYK